MLELPPDLEHQIREEAAQRGQAVEKYLRLIVNDPASRSGSRDADGNAARPREADPAYLLSLPKAERYRIMEAQFDAAAPLYAADLALPVEQRELTAFTALDGDPILEDYAVSEESHVD